MIGYRKKKTGLTLLELIIAVAVLMMVMGGLMSLFAFGHRQSILAHRRTQAGIEAQLQMERLMARSWEDLRDNVFYESTEYPYLTRRPRSDSTCGTFEIEFEYKIRRTNLRSYDTNLTDAIRGHLRLLLDDHDHELLERLPPHAQQSDLWGKGYFYELLDFAEGHSLEESLPESPVLLLVIVKVFDPNIGIIDPLFEHHNIVFVTHNPFA